MNFSEDKDVVAAEKVSFETLRAYLRAKGWRVVASPRHDVETFAQLEGDNIVEVIQLPPGESDRHVAYVLDAARAIANFEGTSLDDALQTLKVFGRDRVSCRLASASVEDGTVPLGDAVSFLANISKIFSAAVKDVVRPESYHKKVVSSEINELMDSARFGQTERGSFVVNVFMPLGMSSDADRPESERGHVFRKGLTHLMKSLTMATQAVEAGAPELFLEQNARADVAASANLLEATDNARVADDSELEFSVEWSPTLPVGADVPSHVRVAKEHSASFWKWSKAYRPQVKEPYASEFLAKVVGLVAQDRDEDGRPSGIATLRIVGEDDNDDVFEASALLNAADFLVANGALMSNSFVAFHGKCERARKKATIEELSKFRVVSQ